MSRLRLSLQSPATSSLARKAALPGGVPLVAVGLTTTLLAFFFAGYGFDDPYITYRYTANVLAGNGFTYNPGSRVLSTTTPLYALLLVLPAAAGLPIPLASNIAGCVSIGFAALALWRLGQLWGTPAAGAIMLLLFPLNPLVLSALGGEGCLYVALILWAFVACTTQRYLAAALLLAAATLTRADGVVAAAAVAVFVLVRRLVHRRRPGSVAAVLRGLPWSALAVYAAVLAIWALFALWYFGSAVPATLAAKQHQGQMAASRSFLRGLYGQTLSLTAGPLLKMQLVFGLLGLLVILRTHRAWLLLLGWSALYTLGYTVLGVSGYFWYYVPLVPALVALVALGIDTVARVLASLLPQARRAQLVRVSLVVVLTAALAIAYASRIPEVRASGYIREPVYRDIGNWLRRHTSADATVGSLEVGIIGYYAQRNMVDFAGLLQPDVAEILGPTTTYDEAATYAVERYRPTHLVLPRGVLPSLEAHSSLQQACRVERTFTDPRYRQPLDVYACSWP